MCFKYPKVFANIFKLHKFKNITKEDNNPVLIRDVCFPWNCSLHTAWLGQDSSLCYIFSIRHNHHTILIFIKHSKSIFKNIVTQLGNTKKEAKFKQHTVIYINLIVFTPITSVGDRNFTQRANRLLKLQSPQTTLCLQVWRRVLATECLHLVQRMGSSANSLWRTSASEVHCLLAPDLLLKK